MLIWMINLGQRRQEYTIGKDRFFDKWYWEDWTATCKRIKLDYFCTKIKWTKHLHVKPEMMKLLGENRAYALWNQS